MEHGELGAGGRELCGSKEVARPTACSIEQGRMVRPCFFCNVFGLKITAGTAMNHRSTASMWYRALRERNYAWRVLGAMEGCRLDG